MLQTFFDGWPDVLRTLLVGPLAYAALVLALRISGKRTLAKMNAFDLVVTVAIGSTLANILLNKDVALVEGAVALAVLVGLQFLVAWLSVRIAWLRRIVRSEPTLLLHHGELLRDAMKAQRVTEDEMQAAIRKAGLMDTQRAASVVLESDGTFSVSSAGATDV